MTLMQVFCWIFKHRWMQRTTYFYCGGVYYTYVYDWCERCHDRRRHI